jgi:hypothetical protein
MRLRLVGTKADDAFVINDHSGVPNATLSYRSCDLYIRRVYPTVSMNSLAQELALTTHFKYPLWHSRINTVQIQAGSTAVDSVGLLSGVIPNVVVVGFYNSTVFNGNYANHPFNATSADPSISSIYIRAGNRRIPANFDYQRDAAGNPSGCMIEYLEYIKASQLCANGQFPNNNPLLSLDEYALNYSFFVFNVKESLETMFGRETDDTDVGSIEVHARMSSTPSNVTMVVCGLTNALVTVDASRRVEKHGF